MKTFKQFFLESAKLDSLVDYLAHKHLTHWNQFVKRGGDYKTFGKLSNPINDRFHPLHSMIADITESGYPEQYYKILEKGHSMVWYKQLQKRVISKVKTYISDERQRKSYGMEYAYPELSNEIYKEVSESNILSENVDLEYFDAIEKGDMEKAGVLVHNKAKEMGYTTKAWHGTPVGEFDSFKLSKSFGSLYFFAKTEEYAKYYANRFTGAPNPKVMEVLLKIENPLKVDTFEPEGVKTAYELRKKGYDSVETPNAYIVFLPDQIKSANTITKKGGKIVPLSKRFNMDSTLLSEYRHNLADGTSAPSLQAHNGKNPNSITPTKRMGTVGDYKKQNPKLSVVGSILSPFELVEMGLEYEHGKVLDNYKNSGFGIQMTSIGGKPVGRVFKSIK